MNGQTQFQHCPPPATSVLSAIGNTPMIKLSKLNSNPLATVYVKLEFLNPSGSIKDRIVRHMITELENQKVIKPGDKIVENSSGNTAAAVAMICGLKGYDATLVVPHKCSKEKQQALTAFGAKLIVAEEGAKSGTPGHYESIAKRIEEEEGAYRLNQYNNQLNVDAHYKSTGPEIYHQVQGNIDYFVAGGSTGGTISGTGKFLKEQNKDIKVVLVDPPGSGLHNQWKTGVNSPGPGKTSIEGIGKGYNVDCMHIKVVDDVLLVKDQQAFLTARQMAKHEGIMCGISAGANVWGALELAKRATKPTTIVTVLPDGGHKYFSKLFNPEWLLSTGIFASLEELDELTKTI